MSLIFGDLAFLIPTIPIVGAFIALFLGKFLDKKNHGNLVALIGLGTSFVLTLLVSGEVVLRLLFEGHVDTSFLEEEIIHENLIQWFNVGDFTLNFGILVDPLSAIISLMVSFVALLVVIYSRSYMSHDGSPRYYAEISLFAAAMLGLCFSPNFIQLFLFWELMGVCSYLLIGYFYDKEVVPEGQPHPASASKKAFLTTKVGDVFLLIGIILVYLETVKASVDPANAAHHIVPTFNFLEIQEYLHEGFIHTDPTLFVFIALLIFGGAVGKSAQFPLHVWLPDAMAGPTTVSCLIHSATMVKAGIFLIARSYFIFEHAPDDALLVVALIGGITAILSGTIAVVQTDIKGILAFSTISQLGYMTIGLGVGGMAVAIFHVINHGIFKALLFLSAGSVIHGSGTQDIREMGGLKEKMPHTWKVMLIGSLSLAGIGNGFFSKDAIISHAKELGTHEPLIALVWLSALITACLTAFYIFRMWFLVFPGENRSDQHIHESDKWMTIPLWSLAIVSVILTVIFSIGLFGDLLNQLSGIHIALLDLFNFEHHFVNWLEPGVDGLVFDLVTGSTSIGVTALGIALAYLIYYPRANAQVSFPKNEPSFKIDLSEAPSDRITSLQTKVRSFGRRIKVSAGGRSIQRILEKGYYIDDFYLAFVKFVDTKYCAAMYWIERNIFDGAVRFVGKVGFAICGASKWWDENVVDRLVRLTAQASVALCGLAKATDERVIDHGIIRSSARGVMKTGGYLRRIQTGVIENYALYTLVGAITIVMVMIVVNGV
jgi:NADH-quinone oxidoreductase subunit L